MKQTILVILCSIFVTSAQAQLGKKIFTMIKNQDIEGLMEMSDTEIDLCLLDDQNIYNRSEAKQKLKRFFSEHQPVSCEKVHTGKSREKKSAYILGKMKTSDGSLYRVFVYANSRNKLMELRIDEW